MCIFLLLMSIEKKNHIKKVWPRIKHLNRKQIHCDQLSNKCPDFPFPGQSQAVTLMQARSLDQTLSNAHLTRAFATSCNTIAIDVLCATPSLRLCALNQCYTHTEIETPAIAHGVRACDFTLRCNYPLNWVVAKQTARGGPRSSGTATTTTRSRWRRPATARNQYFYTRPLTALCCTVFTFSIIK